MLNETDIQKLWKAKEKRKMRGEKLKKTMSPLLNVEIEKTVINGQSVEIKRYPSVQSNPEYYRNRQEEMKKQATLRSRLF